MEINIYQNAIEFLVLEGHTILQVQLDDEFLYFVVFKWQEGYFNTAQSVEFNTVEGINITEFIRKNSALCSNRVEFISNFNKELDKGNLIRLEFQKSCLWFKYSSPIGIGTIKK